MSSTPRKRVVVERRDPEPPLSSARRTPNAASALKNSAHFAGISGKSPIVIEFGSRWTKFGIGGEYTPRNIISSFTINPFTREAVHVLDRSMPENERFETLNVFLKKIIVKELHCIPSERRIVIVENLFVPSETRNLIAKLLFEVHSFQVPSLIFVPAPLMNTTAFGTKNALVIDIGYQSTSVFPVFDSLVVFSAYEENGVGGGTMTARINEYICKKGQIRDHDGTLRAMNEEEKMEFQRRKVDEDITARFFMVTRMDRAKVIHEIEQNNEPETPLQFAPDVELPFGTRKLIIPGYLRESAAECFFEKEEMNLNVPIPQLALKSLIKAPVDTRRPLLNNVIITGSAAGLPGMLGRFMAEFKELLKGTFPKLVDEVKILRLPSNNGIERYSSWLGGSLFGIEEMNHRFYTKTDWENKKLLPDWTNMFEDIKIQSVPGMIVSERNIEKIAITRNPAESVA